MHRNPKLQPNLRPCNGAPARSRPWRAWSRPPRQQLTPSRLPSLTDSLNRVAFWLAAHAPRILSESLNPGAEAAELNALQNAVGQPLPDDYRALYQRHDGLNDEENAGNFFYGLQFLPLAHVRADFQQRREAAPYPLAHAGPGIHLANALTPNWLALAFDGSHGWLRLDLAPAEGGHHGQVIFWDEEYETAFPVAPSVAALLATFATDLEAGRYHLHPEALADGHEFLQPVRALDMVNWRTAARFRRYAALK